MLASGLDLKEDKKDWQGSNPLASLSVMKKKEQLDRHLDNSFSCCRIFSFALSSSVFISDALAVSKLVAKI
jgi:hypothetical protein